MATAVDPSRITAYYQLNIASIATDTDTTNVIPGRAGHQAVCLRLEATSGSAGSLITFHPGTNAGKTTIQDDAADDATSIDLDGDATADTLNGHLVTTNDFVLLNISEHDRARGAWQLASIGGLGGGTSDTIDITTLTPYDGGTGLEGALVAGDTAFVVDSADVTTIALGATSISLENVYAGTPHNPVGVKIEANGATAHYLTSLWAYVKLGA